MYVLENAPERFRSKVKINDSNGCWEWVASIRPNGYGQFYSEHLKYSDCAHRWAFHFFNKPIPLGFQIDHVCGNKKCVNPHHLRMCTPRENTLAEHSLTPARINFEKTHCIRGHLFFEKSQHNKRRHCKTCLKEASLRRKEQKIKRAG